jgi:hypothetical protein
MVAGHTIRTDLSLRQAAIHPQEGAHLDRFPQTHFHLQQCHQLPADVDPIAIADQFADTKRVDCLPMLGCGGHSCTQQHLAVLPHHPASGISFISKQAIFNPNHLHDLHTHILPSHLEPKKALEVLASLLF